VTKGEHGSCGLFYRHITIKMMIASDNCKGRLYYKQLTLALALTRVINYAPRAMLQIVTSLKIITYNHSNVIMKLIHSMTLKRRAFASSVRQALSNGRCLLMTCNESRS
jgi:hypothetical protein